MIFGEKNMSEKSEKTSCSGKRDKKQEAEQDAALRSALDKIRHKFIVMSGKGGVGKTSVSVNLAIALAAKGFQVGLMDVDIHGPDVPRMLGLKGMLDLNAEQKLIPMKYSANLSAVSIESLISGKDDAIIWRGPVKNSVIRQFISDVCWGDLDYLLIDAPPGTGDEPLTIAQLIPDANAVIITTPQEVSLADVRKSINFCKTVNMNIFGLVENMSGFHCPHCGTEIDMFGVGGGEKTAEQMNIRFLGRIPFDSNVVGCGDAGTSYQSLHGHSQVTAAFANIAQKIIADSQGLRQ
jgi:Mrp family chromosome partitioning ATPase